MNFDAISKNVKILQIGPVEPKLWKIREINVVWLLELDHAGVKKLKKNSKFSRQLLSVYASERDRTYLEWKIQAI